jgi:hypothetical protein
VTLDVAGHARPSCWTTRLSEVNAGLVAQLSPMGMSTRPTDVLALARMSSLSRGWSSLSRGCPRSRNKRSRASRVRRERQCPRRAPRQRRNALPRRERRTRPLAAAVTAQGADGRALLQRGTYLALRAPVASGLCGAREISPLARLTAARTEKENGVSPWASCVRALSTPRSDTALPMEPRPCSHRRPRRIAGSLRWVWCSVQRKVANPYTAPPIAARKRSARRQRSVTSTTVSAIVELTERELTERELTERELIQTGVHEPKSASNQELAEPSAREPGAHRNRSSPREKEVRPNTEELRVDQGQAAP